jgi:transketolase C-terminal domain/subunit
VLHRGALRTVHLRRLHERESGVGTHEGIRWRNGYSQMGVEDIATIRSLPNIGIIQPDGKRPS